MSLLRITIEYANRTVAYFKAKRQVDIPSNIREVRVNLGCGLAVEKGWINIDGSLNALVSSMPSS